MSIKDYPIRAISKGKKRGRPSKKELITSLFLSSLYISNKKQLRQAILDRELYGQGIVKGLLGKIPKGEREMKGKCKYLKDGLCRATIDDPYGEPCLGFEKCDAYEEEES